jgi:hypothetical protein
VLHGVPHEQGVILVEELGIGGQGMGEQIPELVVTGGFGGEPESLADPAGEGVDDEKRILRRVQQDGVGCFWSDPLQTEQLQAQLGGRPAGERGGAAVISVEYMGGKLLESLGFLVEIARRTDEARQLFQGEVVKRAQTEGAVGGKGFEA